MDLRPNGNKSYSLCNPEAPNTTKAQLGTVFRNTGALLYQKLLQLLRYFFGGGGGCSRCALGDRGRTLKSSRKLTATPIPCGRRGAELGGAQITDHRAPLPSVPTRHVPCSSPSTASPPQARSPGFCTPPPAGHTSPSLITMKLSPTARACLPGTFKARNSMKYATAFPAPTPRSAPSL